MKRREFLKKAGTGAAAAVAATAVMAPAVIAKKSYRWKMVTTWPPKLPVLQTGAELFAKRVDECTGGRLKIKVYAGGELVPPLNTFDAVSAGTVESGSAASYYWAGKMPASQWFAAVPFGLNAARDVCMVVWRRRSETLGRDLCALQRDSQTGRLHRGPDGWVV